jgi:hypothetical protein
MNDLQKALVAFVATAKAMGNHKRSPSSYPKCPGCSQPIRPKHAEPHVRQVHAQYAGALTCGEAAKVGRKAVWASVG